MGNIFDSRPTSYSDQTTWGKTPQMYGDYEASYRQDSTTADSMDYGNTKLQFGVKMLEDIDPGPKQGDMYVNTPSGERVYFTYKGSPYPDAAQRIAMGANYGNGPAVSITGSPLNPQYAMYYARGGDQHTGDDWTPIQINSQKDVMEAMRSGDYGRDINTGKYSNMYGMASINPFGSKEAGDVWTGATAFDNTVTGVIGQLIVPVAEMGLDDLVPFASDILNVTGASKAIQGGIDSLMQATQGRTYQGTKHFDPTIANTIKDPRLSGFLTKQQDQSQAFVAKYGDKNYSDTQRLAQDTQSQKLEKAQQLFQENQDMYVQGEVQKITDLGSKLQTLLPNVDTDLFTDIQSALGQVGRSNQQKMNIIRYLTKRIKTELLPALSQMPTAPATPPPTSPQTPKTDPVETASAQVGHPVLSINGTDSRPPTQHVITGNPFAFAPVV